MNIIEIIEHKKDGLTLSNEELDFAFNGYLNHQIEDYQMSSLLMAIQINGMSFDETKHLTDLMIKSGETIDTSLVDGVMVDKHSTGGVGDKTTFIIGPILASLGLKFGKMSGRGLGITGGTIDKLESIGGIRSSITNEEFISILNDIGLVITSQSPRMTPLDKVIYELRDVSGNVSSIPLIASSIMSKKIAVGAKNILIDIKVGCGALIKSHDDATKLANTLVKLGRAYGVKVIPVLTDMNEPLGNNVGNALEVIEALDVLNGKRGALYELCVALSSILYANTMNITMEEARSSVTRVIDNKDAYNKFLEFVSRVDGNISDIKVCKNRIEVISESSGKVEEIRADKIGLVLKEMGAGRIKKNDLIRYDVGIVLKVHAGEYIKVGDTLCYIYHEDAKKYVNLVKDAFLIVK